MIMETHEVYCSLDTCKLLKQAGFDWECETHYHNGCLDSIYGEKHDYNSERYEDGGYNEYCSAPTLEVAQRWLREVKGYYVDVTFRNLSLDYRPRIHKMVKGTSYMIYLGDIISLYESALEAGIKKALKIILEKWE